MSRSRKRSRRGQSTKSSQTARAIGVLVLLGVCVYIAVATTAGNFIANNIVAPMFNFLDSKLAPKDKGAEDVQDTANEPADTILEDGTQEQAKTEESLSLSPKSDGVDSAGTTAAADDTKTNEAETSEQITIEACKIYALQMGAFSSQENAETEATTLKARGAGGYILDDGHFRVFASMYDSQEDARKVKVQLLEENAIEASIYEVDIPGAVLKVTAGPGKLDAVRDAFDALDAAQKGIFELCSKFDKKEVSQEEAVTQLKELLEKAKKPADTLRGVGAGVIGEAVLASLDKTIASIENCIAKTATELEFSADLKYNHMAQVCDYAELLKTINASAS